MNGTSLKIVMIILSDYKIIHFHCRKSRMQKSTRKKNETTVNANTHFILILLNFTFAVWGMSYFQNDTSSTEFVG